MTKNKYFINKVNNEFNVNKNYNEIINKIENKKRFSFKVSYALCSFVFIFLISTYMINSKINYININDINNLSINSNYKLEEANFISRSTIFNVPNEYSMVNKFDVYNNNEMVNEMIVYKYNNENSNKEIKVSYSEENKPLCEYNLDNIEDSYINSNKVKIYNYENTYIVEFKYNDIYYNIITKNIEKNELIDLLKLNMEE